MKHTFSGGFHIHDHKSLTNSKPTILAPDCDEHIFPLRQHIGAELSPLVAVGDHVNVGQKIADSDAFLSVPVHSSISGTVTAIKPHIHPNGSLVSSIFIENDKLYTLDESVKGVDIDKMSHDELISFVREKGLVGMGGAGFPTFVKLNPNKKIDYVIVNGAECEPYITADHKRMIEYTDTLIDGLKIAMKILSLEKGYFGIEANKPDAIKKISDAVSSIPEIEVKVLKTKYPQGGEKQLIKAITGRKVPSGKLPADVGVVVLNVYTVFSLAKAFREGLPPIKRIITVTGDAVANPQNIKVRLGVPYSFLFDLAGGFSEDPEKVISGGPMMGAAQYSLNSPVIKTTSALLALKKAPEIYSAATPCIRCGKCVEHCPMHLMPLNIAKFAVSENYDLAEKYHATDCMDCGLCSYICPSNRNPVEYIRRAKQAILAKKKGGK